MKNAKFTVLKDTLPNQKQFAVIVENSVNKITLGFEKEQLLDDWVKAIQAIEDDEYRALIALEPELKKK